MSPWPVLGPDSLAKARGGTAAQRLDSFGGRVGGRLGAARVGSDTAATSVAATSDRHRGVQARRSGGAARRGDAALAPGIGRILEGHRTPRTSPRESRGRWRSQSGRRGREKRQGVPRAGRQVRDEGDDSASALSEPGTERPPPRTLKGRQIPRGEPGERRHTFELCRRATGRATLPELRGRDEVHEGSNSGRSHDTRSRSGEDDEGHGESRKVEVGAAKPCAASPGGDTLKNPSTPRKWRPQQTG